MVVSEKKKKNQSLNADPVGRNVDEILRTVAALKHAEEHPGEACPGEKNIEQEKKRKLGLISKKVGWVKGAKTVKTDPEGSKAYFQSVNKK